MEYPKSEISFQIIVDPFQSFLREMDFKHQNNDIALKGLKCQRNGK